MRAPGNTTTPKSAPGAATELFEEKRAAAAPPRTATATRAADPPAAQPPSAAPLDAGQTIGEFRLIAKLGQGGMGAVFEAHQTSMDRTVALKLLSRELAANRAFVERFYREARTMAKLDHPNIVRGYAVGEENGQHYVAMELIDGSSIQNWLDKLGKLSVPDAVHVALLAARALQHAHEQGLVHRDIKPDNILITSRGEVKVADLGLAKATDDDLGLTQTGTGFGTPYYMPMEQYRDAKHVDARADIYALGVTLYVLVTGEVPFKGETHVQVIEAKQIGRFTPARRLNLDVPERLDLMLDKMIAKDPRHRYQTCSELADDLASLGAASESLGFVGPSATRVRWSAPSAKGPGATRRPHDLPDPELWVVRYTNAQGKRVKQPMSLGRLRQLLENSDLDAGSTQATKPGEQKPRPLGSFAEFESLVRAKRVTAKSERRSNDLARVYRKIDRAERRRRLFRWLGGGFRQLFGWLVILAVVAGVVVGGFLLYQNRQALLNKLPAKISTGGSAAGS